MLRLWWSVGDGGGLPEMVVVSKFIKGLVFGWCKVAVDGEHLARAAGGGGRWWWRTSDGCRISGDVA
nr:hypothetical protein [Tanacetum cinerariifolium]